MTSNLENDRSSITSKMYPIDLAPQKITIVKGVSNTEVKMAHLLPGQPKSSNTGQIITHTGPVGLMRPATQIISQGGGSQPQMIVSASPILQGTQIVSQGSQIISQSQLIGPGGQILSPATQIISQGSQLSGQVSSANSGTGNIQSTSVSGTQVLNMTGQLVSGTGNLVVSSSVRTLPPSVKVLPPLPHYNSRPAAVLTNVSVSNASGVLVSKSVSSHVPRGLAAGASLAVRPVLPSHTSHATPSTQGGAWSNSSRNARSSLVFGSRPRATLQPTHHVTHTPVITLPTTTVLTSSVISNVVRTPSPAPVAVAPRPLPLLQKNYQPAKVVGVGSVNVRGVGNSAPTQLYYEVPRPAPSPQPNTGVTVNIVNAVSTIVQDNSRQMPIVASVPPNTTIQPRPTILRKREPDVTMEVRQEPKQQFSLSGGWEDVAGGRRDAGSGSGSTTVSAASSPAPSDEPEPPDEPKHKARKHSINNDVRQNDFTPEQPATPPAPVNPPPKRPQLSSSFVCGWRSTALHFVRPSDVKRKEPRARDILAIAGQKHILNTADGWKVHHLTAQMEDLVSLEADVGDQLENVLRALESASGRATTALQPHAHTLLELLKGNIQRSKIVCEGIQEAREDILRVFTHRNFVSDILTRQADKRCFRKHRSQS